MHVYIYKRNIDVHARAFMHFCKDVCTCILSVAVATFLLFMKIVKSIHIIALYITCSVYLALHEYMLQIQPNPITSVTHYHTKTKSCL